MSLQAGPGKGSAQLLQALHGVSTKPAAAAVVTLPVLQHSKPAQPAYQNKTPAQSVFDDFPADESDEDQNPCRTAAAAATAAKHQLSTLQQNKSARTTNTSKHTDQQQQRSTLKLSLDLFSNKPNNSTQQQQQRGSNPVAAFSRTASKGPGRAGTGAAAAVAHSWLQPLPGLVSTPADSPAADAAGIASSRGKQARSKPHPSTEDKALSQAHKPESAGNISRPSTHQQTTTATFSLPGLAARQPPRPKAPPAAATAGAALLSLKPATATGVGAAAASKGGASLQPLGGLGCHITSAEGELELMMLSPAEPAAAGGDRDSDASFEDSQQQRQSSRTKQQQPKPVSEFDFAGDSQELGSAGRLNQGRGAEADSSGYSQGASLSGPESASMSNSAADDVSASDADVAASPSSGDSGSLWSGGSSGAAANGSCGSSEGTGDDSDVSFKEKGRKRKQTGQGRGRQVGARAKARKALLDDDAATAADGKKVCKAVRFADDIDNPLMAADSKKQQQARKQQESHRSSSSSLKASSKAAGAAVALDQGAVLPGEVSNPSVTLSAAQQIWAHCWSQCAQMCTPCTTEARRQTM